VIIVIAVVAAILWVPSPWSWVVIGAGVVLESADVVFWWFWGGRRWRAKVGVETLIGREAIVVSPCRPEGQVRIDGELWQAHCSKGAARGEAVLISGMNRLTLTVTPVESVAPAQEGDSGAVE
jgi:membrane protein implicated in regulation of membrane protease activity